MLKRHDKSFRQLYQVLANMQGPEEISAFLEDLCTVAELESFAQRLEVARCLNAGMNYAQVTRATGVSSATISRVNRCLNYGAGGYQAAFEHMEGEAEQ